MIYLLKHHKIQDAPTELGDTELSDLQEAIQLFSLGCAVRFPIELKRREVL